VLRNYLLLAFKNLGKQKIFSVINLLGLTVGITCCLMLFGYIKHELSYDSFHTKGKSIYRIVRQADLMHTGSKQDIAWVSGPYAIALKNDYPDIIERAVRVSPDNDLFSYKTNSFNETRVYITDTDFFQLFDFHLLKGDPATVLLEPHSIVLTASTAKKYFGDEDPMGKIIQMNQEMPLKVTGIAEDVPSNSHLNFDMVIPISNWKFFDSLGMFPNNGLYTYLLLKPNANPKTLLSRFPAFMDKYMGKYYTASGFKMDLGMQPLKDVYFSVDPFDSAKHGDKKIVFVFMSIAILILVIACINFMNLASARASDRSKEVGIRKVMGALRGQLIGQFILEAFLYATASSILALLLLQILQPAYNELLGYQAPSFWKDPWTYACLGGIILVIGLLAGIYPALVMSSFSPIEALKGKLRVGKGGSFFRKALVVFQFGVSVGLIICITVIASQIHFVKSQNLGFSKEESMLVRIDNNDIDKNKRTFKFTAQQDPSVMSVSLMSGEPGGFHDTYTFETEAKPGEKLLMNTEYSDFQLVQTLGLKVIAGRNFSPQYPTDSSKAVLINRSAAEKLGYTPEQAIGKWIKNVSRDSTHRLIIGVLEDFHFASLKDKIEPMIFSIYPDLRVAVIRLKPGVPTAAINRIRKIYAGLAPAYPFEYTFLDEQYDRHYKDDIRQGDILSIFSGIAIFIACLGLFGLASYTAIKRTKEIGVRKVLGSSVQGIVVLLSKDLLKPVVLGSLIAIPAGYYLMDKWLQNFAYRIGIQWWMFALACAVAVLIALVTVSSQAIKAALANPVKSLRSE